VDVVSAPSDRIGALLDKCDLVFISGGRTAYEATALGVPAIVLCQNQRELARIQQFERLGSILLLGLGSEVTRAQLIRALKRIASDAKLWERMSTAGQQIMDGRGVERISQIVADLLGKQMSAID
jgi:spore coat polysaccharide biosynthesis predicted glycosyltransferase SpsG